MGKPILVVVGSCTSNSARILAVFDADVAATASLAFRISGSSSAQTVSVPVVAADPYFLARFEISGLSASAKGTRIEYSVFSGSDAQAGKYGSFKLLPEDSANLRFALLSCNGTFLFSNSDRRYAMWRKVAEKIQAGEIDLLIHAGDQIYADSIRMQQHLKSDTSISPPMRMESLSSEFRKLYVETWSVPEMANVLASCPSIMMWDDHEIYDGYGSHDDDVSVSAQMLYAAAQKTFREFQAGGNPDPLSSASHAFAFRLCSVAFLALDERQNRMWSRRSVLGSEQLSDIQAWLASDAALNLAHLFIVTAIPMVYVPVVGYLKFLQTVGWDAPFTEDLRDSWSAPNNQEEGKRLLDVIFSYQGKNPKTRITLLSGDVHVGSFARIGSPRAAHKIFQVVSSGIGSPPPSGLSALMLRLAVDEEVTLPGSDYQGCLLKIAELDRCYIRRRNFALLQTESNKVNVKFFLEGKTGIEEISRRLPD